MKKGRLRGPSPWCLPSGLVPRKVELPDAHAVGRRVELAARDLDVGHLDGRHPPARHRPGARAGLPEHAVVRGEARVAGLCFIMTPTSFATYRSSVTESYAAEVIGRSPSPLGPLPTRAVQVASSRIGS